jgi:class 3 adenylate cyclase/tetratricopeptide (TPR) repeat protein
MPVFDALSRMSREPGGDAVVTTLAQRAPTWLAQMPWLLGAEELAALRARAAGSTRHSMLREMVEALEAMSHVAPVALVLDDLHWADHATLDLIEALAVRDEPARLLVLGTYWRADAQARKHPVCELMDELASRNRCVGFALRPLTDEAAADYVAYRLGGTRVPPATASVLRERTGGNPLYLEHVVDDLIATGRARQENGSWTLEADPAELAAGVPDSLRRLVEQDLLRLDEPDRRLVEAASVVGVEFSGIELAAALDASVPSTEARAVDLAGRGRLLDRGDPIELDDGIVSEQLRFKHELYRDVVYELLPASMRSALHERLGAYFELRHATTPTTIAPELAYHFARANDHARAVRYGELAARHALDRRAPADAIGHLRAALDSLSTLGDSSDRVRYELELQLLLGQALVAEIGWSDPEAERALVRARALAEELGDNEPLVTVLLSLATLYEVRGDVTLALQLAEERLRLVPDAPAQRELESNELLACTLLHQGAFARALEQAELGMTLAKTEDGHYDTFPGTLGDNAGISCHSWAASALWYLGQPDQALRRAQEAVRMAQDPQRQYSLATAQAQMALLHQCRQEPEDALEWADATIELATERGYAYRVAMGIVLRGWALAALEDVDAGIDELERGLRAARATGAHLDDPHFLGLLADAQLRGRHTSAALAAVEEALEIAERRRSRSYQAELLRLRGAILRTRGDSALEVERSLHEALAVARTQEARMLELRIATTLASVWRDEGRTREARSLLAGVYDEFAEGFETPDLRAAAALLDDLARTPVTVSARRESPTAPSSADVVVSSRADRHRSPIRYTKSGGLSIAYQVTGGGPLDLVLVPGFVSHLEKDWDEPRHARFLDRLGSFSRLIRFDKRGTGLSDRPGDLPDLETRMGDVRAVMDAVGSERAVLFGYSEGGPMSILFAATYPERVHALVLYGTYARRVRADDYPWAATEEERMAYADQIEREWAWEADMRQMCPNADDAMARWWGERARAAASPGAARNLILMNSHIDVRDVLPAVHVRTLVLHRTHDPDASVEGGRYVAEHIPGARFVELPGIDHFVAMDPDQILDEVEEFITGVRPAAQVHRVLGSILFSDIVGSTELARKLGDREWSDLLAQHDRTFHQLLGSFGGELVDTAGDGVLALFDGPARAIRCGLAVRDHIAKLGLELRVGIHTGEIERQGGTVRGIAVHLAARVADVAQAGEVLVTSTTKDLVEGSGIAFAEHGEWSFKGFDTPRRVFAALSTS